MTRFLIVATLTVFALGCGQATESNAPANNKMDSATYVRPAEDKLGVTTMADFSAASGLKAYPGSETAAGETFKHGDDAVKSIIIFTTADPLTKIAAFYKAQGLDTVVATKIMGMTKTKAQVIIDVTAGPNGKNVVKVTGLVQGKKA